VNAQIPSLQAYCGTIGASVSGTFLWIIGILNLLVLLDIVRVFREMRTGKLDEERLEQRLLERGLMSRLFIGRVANRIRESWQMYPLGVLFGLGFDTATEVGLLAISAGLATNTSHVPFLAVLSLPLLFAAGMSLMDTADGAFMSHAYTWAFSNPVRKVYYNLTVTTLSVVVALGIGSVELLQVFGAPGFEALDFNLLGYGIVGLFVATWATSALVWKVTRLEERLLDRGLMSRGLLRRLGARITSSWHMYPLGILFGLGFDTATEVGLLGVSAGAATHRVPFLAILSLPLLFAAGMSLMDTADGAFMAHAYGWAFASPVRKVYYNLTVTTLSVTVALGIGLIELLQVAARSTWLDFNTLGYGMVGLFVLTWAVSAVIWKTRRIEERWSAASP